MHWSNFRQKFCLNYSVAFINNTLKLTLTLLAAYTIRYNEANSTWTYEIWNWYILEMKIGSKVAQRQPPVKAQCLERLATENGQQIYFNGSSPYYIIIPLSVSSSYDPYPMFTMYFYNGNSLLQQKQVLCAHLCVTLVYFLNCLVQGTAISWW